MLLMAGIDEQRSMLDHNTTTISTPPQPVPDAYTNAVTGFVAGPLPSTVGQGGYAPILDLAYEILWHCDMRYY